MWQAIASALLPKLAGNIFGKDGEDVVSQVGDKVFGVPTPETPDMAQQGLDYRSYLDSAFPGTTPWERLGASTPAGAIESANVSRKAQMEMQKKELTNARLIAATQARASVIAATSGVSPMAAKSAVDLLERGAGGAYDTVTQQGGRKLPSEIDERSASARAKRAESVLTEAKGQYAPAMAKAEVAAERNRNPWTTMYNVGERMSETLQDMKRVFYNNGKRPVRFDPVKRSNKRGEFSNIF